MSFEEVRQMLESIPGFSEKVAYRAFPENEAPALPFICFYEEGTDNVFADDTVIVEKTNITIELYEDFRSREIEKAIEETLTTNHLPWNRDPEWIDDERMWMIIYEIEV